MITILHLTTSRRYSLISFTWYYLTLERDFFLFVFLLPCLAFCNFFVCLLRLPSCIMFMSFPISKFTNNVVLPRMQDICRRGGVRCGVISIKMWEQAYQYNRGVSVGECSGGDLRWGADGPFTSTDLIHPLEVGAVTYHYVFLKQFVVAEHMFRLRQGCCIGM